MKETVMTHMNLSANLNQFTGSEQWFRHPLNRKVLYTEGAQYLAEHGSAYWLLDAIAFAQIQVKCVTAEAFQVWTLRVDTDHSATLTCDDGNGNIVFRQLLDYTDFPLAEVKLYYCNQVIHLPSEY
jgi:hypothetical protein